MGSAERLSELPPARAEERKVVTALFCDLVGFTATSESADPEDVDQMLAAYFAMARDADRGTRRRGGEVHRRRGRRGLRGPRRPRGRPRARSACGLADLSRTPSSSRPSVARRSSSASGSTPARRSYGSGSPPLRARGSSRETRSTPPRGSSRSPPRWAWPWASAPTRRRPWSSTTRSWTPPPLKGKSDPVRVFHARSPLARFGTDLTRTHDTPFIGREIDLALLKGIFDKTVAANSPQLVTVVGEPGLGKSPDRRRTR